MSDPNERYAIWPRRITETVLGSPGHTSIELRRAVEARAARLGGRPGAGDGVPEPLAGYVDKIALRAYTITDADLTALERAGYSDDALFEVTVSAALGAALARLERGLAALRGS
jgi:alkylhydroperoxidase family enzyme